MHYFNPHSPKLTFDLGLRAESQQVSETLRLTPRAGVVWNPLSRSGTIVRAGIGVFYDRVPLNVYSFDHYPNQIITTFDGAGQIASGPFQSGGGSLQHRRSRQLFFFGHRGRRFTADFGIIF